MTVVLAIDQGTSGTKALVVEGDAVLAAVERPLTPRHLPGGRVEQDPAELLASVLEAGAAALRQAGARPDAVALANQGETVLAWDPASGAPRSDLLVWQDRRAEEQCRALAPEAERIAQRTGLVLDPYFSAPKQAWLRQHGTREGVVTTSDVWLLHHLTGRFVTDAATASRSLVADLDGGGWDPELLGLFGLADEPLPAILANDEVAGTTSAFGPEAPVAGLIVDQQAALLAEGCLAPGEAKCTLGTGAFLLANTGPAPVRSTAGLAASVAWRARGATAHCVDGQVYAAASAVRWMQGLGLVGSAADLDAVAAPDAEGVLAVPALAGLAAPGWRPRATASIAGMTLSTGPGHLVLAVLQGIAAQVVELARRTADDLGAPIARLRVDGGLTRSARLVQAIADQLQVPVDVYPSAHATPLGAAALARCALEPALALRDAVVPWTPARSVEPRWDAGRADEFHARWLSLAAAGER